jgi:hypothetical protein
VGFGSACKGPRMPTALYNTSNRKLPRDKTELDRSCGAAFVRLVERTDEHDQASLVQNLNARLVT